MKKANTSTNSLAPIFEKVEQLSKSQRIIIYSATVVVLIALSIWLLFWPKFGKIESLNKELAAVQTDLEKAKKNAAELNDWRNQMKQRETKYQTVMRALPEKEEIPSLLSGISQAGRDAGLEIQNFTPKPEVAKEFYAEIPVDISISGTYHNVAVFFDKVANLPRIVNIRDIKMVPSGEGKGLLLTSCQAVTYKFIEASQASQKKRPRR